MVNDKKRGKKAGPSDNVVRKTTRYDTPESNHVVVFGDGDFSFSAGLLRHRGGSPLGLVCTSYDSAEECLAKYPETAPDNLQDLHEAGVLIFHRIDATRPLETLAAAGYSPQRTQCWDRMVWNFPHTGTQRTHENRNVLSQFLASARPLLKAPRGQAHVTIKLAPPYDRWGLGDEHGVAEGTGMAVGGETPFDASLFPGYHHQTTLADAAQLFTQKNGKGKGKGGKGKGKGKGNGGGNAGAMTASRCRTFIFVPAKLSKSEEDNEIPTKVDEGPARASSGAVKRNWAEDWESDAREVTTSLELEKEDGHYGNETAQKQQQPQKGQQAESLSKNQKQRRAKKLKAKQGLLAPRKPKQAGAGSGGSCSGDKADAARAMFEAAVNASARAVANAVKCGK
mmetsp:Transcript_17382/g.34349  ORF Transcript_17382/g.34349 Transcript_17382/m.34349 type:complete len:396 (+) Transcript_17382:155-1342(+)